MQCTEQCTFIIISRGILFRKRNVSEKKKFIGTQNHILYAKSIFYHHHHHHHHHHIQEGLGLIPVPCILKMKLVPPSLPRSSYVLRPFGLYCSACLGILFVSILCMCCSHFSWYCFISFTIFSASKHSEYPQKKEADRHSSIFFIEKNLWSSAK